MANRSETDGVVHKAPLSASRRSPRAPYRPRDPSVTSRMMSAVRSRENKAEVLLRKRLWRLGLRYRLYAKDLPGRPDIVLPRHRIVIFVDGDFWHGRVLVEAGVAAFKAQVRGKTADWWLRKIARTVDRDRGVTACLEENGWRVIRLWESEVLVDPEAVATSVLARIQLGP